MLAAVSEDEISSTVYTLPAIVTSAEGFSLSKLNFSALCNNTKFVPSVALATVYVCPNILISSPSELALLKSTALLKVTDAL